MSSASMFDTTTTLAGIVLVTVPTIAVAALLQAIEAQVGD
jgi:predicted dinucleotide-binding enzyme